MTALDNRSEARVWADRLIAQRHNVPGAMKWAPEYAQQMLEADYEPEEVQSIIDDLTARKLELRGIHDTRASEIADTIWRTITTLKERLAAAAPDHSFAQGHSPPPDFIVGPGRTETSSNGWTSKKD